MKKIILLLTILFSITIHSQNIKVENGVFYTTAKNGLNQVKNITFKIDNPTIEKIKVSEEYKDTLKDKDFLNGTKTKNKISSSLAAHLFSLVNNAVLNTGWNIKNEISLDFIEKTVGEIYFNVDEEMIVSFYFKSKNEKGNDLLSKAEFNSTSRNLNISN
tara:strand:- start:222 stop:701 length:480 start_codon:yes stop_codon:yes gene_type:complete